MKYVLLYTSADGVAERAPAVFPRHRERYEEFHRRGLLLLVGPFEDAQEDGAMSVFTTREAAEEFAQGDPFVLEGVVSSWTVRGWREVLMP
ncbi:MAG TPA: YciI family protein [Conexibacter sp.]|nr:YciI family protein [Conexibacter sp.]